MKKSLYFRYIKWLAAAIAFLGFNSCVSSNSGGKVNTFEDVYGPPPVENPDTIVEP